MTDQGGEKPFKATGRKLREARKRGEVARSQELTSATVLGAAILVGLVESHWMAESLRTLMETILAGSMRPSRADLARLGFESARVFAELVVAFALPVAGIALVVNFLQVGPVLASEPIAPKLDRLNPMNALKRLWSTDNLVELAKSLAKVGVLASVVVWVVARQINQLGGTVTANASDVSQALSAGIMHLAIAAGLISAAVAIADLFYQRFSFLKKQRMSVVERRRERRDQMGEPRIRQQRRKLHREWASQNVGEAARKATVLVMNPTHLAVALAYDPAEHAAPIVTAKGEDHVAMEMRDEAEAGGVPVARNVTLARALYERTDLEDAVPEELFGAVAEVILWARRVRAATDAEAAAGREADVEARE